MYAGKKILLIIRLFHSNHLVYHYLPDRSKWWSVGLSYMIQKHLTWSIFFFFSDNCNGLSRIRNGKGMCPKYKNKWALPIWGNICEASYAKSVTVIIICQVKWEFLYIGNSSRDYISLPVCSVTWYLGVISVEYVSVFRTVPRVCFWLCHCGKKCLALCGM